MDHTLFCRHLNQLICVVEQCIPLDRAIPNELQENVCNPVRSHLRLGRFCQEISYGTKDGLERLGNG